MYGIYLYTYLYTYLPTYIPTYTDNYLQRLDIPNQKRYSSETLGVGRSKVGTCHRLYKKIMWRLLAEGTPAELIIGNPYIYQTKRDIVLKLWGCVDLRSGRVIGYIKKLCDDCLRRERHDPVTGRGSALQPLRFCNWYIYICIHRQFGVRFLSQGFIDTLKLTCTSNEPTCGTCSSECQKNCDVIMTSSKLVFI